MRDSVSLLQSEIRHEKMAEEFIYGMVKCAAKFEEGKSKNVRIHTFWRIVGKDSYRFLFANNNRGSDGFPVTIVSRGKGW